MNFDILVIGGGIAGLYTALKLAPKRVLLVADTKIGEGGSTPWAQGGIAAAVGPDDHPSLHAQDTLNAGAGLCQEDAVDVLTQNAKSAIEDLESMGLEFHRNAMGQYDLHQEGAHSCRRVLHIDGDQTGYALIKHLTSLVVQSDHIHTINNLKLFDLQKLDDHLFQAQLYDAKTKELVKILTPQVVLATGGSAGLWKSTTNPSQSAGIALSICFKMGAKLRDLEFMQFHPTAIDIGKDPMPLATEALRGEGAKLVDQNRLSLMSQFSSNDDLAPRYEVARAVWLAKNSGSGAFLDLSSIENLAEKYPFVLSICKSAGLNPLKDLLPIAPAAHYHMGGVWTDLDAQSSIKGLWVVGEAASTGVHGANRLASNSLLEGLVFGARAAQSIKSQVNSLGFSQAQVVYTNTKITENEINHDALRNMMDLALPTIRTTQNIQTLCNDLPLEELIKLEPSINTHHAIAASLIAQMALARKETRGAHRTINFKQTDALALHSFCTLSSSGACEIWHAPVQMSHQDQKNATSAH